MQIGVVDDNPQTKGTVSIHTTKIIKLKTRMFIIFDVIQKIFDFTNCSLIISIIVLLTQQGYSDIYSYITFLAIMLMINHVTGTFLFMNILLPVSIFPSRKFFDYEKYGQTIYILQITVSVLSFLTIHLKHISRSLLNNNSSHQLYKMSHKYFTWQQTKLFEKQSNIAIQNLIVIITNLILCVALILIYHYGILIDNTNKSIQFHYAIIYTCIPMLFVLVYIIGFGLQTLIGIKNKQLPMQLANNTQNIVFKLNCVMTLKYMFFFVIIGLVVTCLSNAFYVIWGLLHRQFSQKEGFPKFNYSQSYYFSSTIVSYFLSQCFHFSIFLATPQAKFLILMERSKPSQRRCKSSLIFKQYLQINAKYQITNMILFGATVTTFFADLISLLFKIFSAKYQGSGTTEEILIVAFSSIASVFLIAVYITLLVKQAKKQNQNVFFGILTFIFGIFAIPAILSIKLMQQVITSILPCQWRETMVTFLNSQIIPFSTIIAFLQSVPFILQKQCIPIDIYKFKQYVINKQKEQDILEKQLTFSQQQVQDQIENTLRYTPQLENIEIELGQEQPQQNNMQPDFEEIYKMALLTRQPFINTKPRVEEAYLKTEQHVKLANKLKTIFLINNNILHITIGGTRSVLHLAPQNIISGIYDWCCLAFSTIKPLFLENSQITWFYKQQFKKAERIYNLLHENNYTSNISEVVICGHHQGAVVSLLLSYLIFKKDNYKKVRTYCFGTPHTVSQELIFYLQQKLQKIFLFQIGYDGKLFLSSILSNQLRWSNTTCITVPHSSAGDHIMGYIGILNCGSTEARCGEAIKDVADNIKLIDQQKQQNNKENVEQ